MFQQMMELDIFVYEKTHLVDEILKKAELPLLQQDN